MTWRRKLFAYPEVWVLVFLALLTRLWQLWSPSSIVFDETYFRQFAADYLSGSYFFDIHPPLVKLLFAGVASFFHLDAATTATDLSSSFILRLLPALAGAALIPLTYVILRQLGLGRKIATFGALLVLCDNALLVESRFVLMDSILLLTGLGVLSSYLVLRKHSGMARWGWVVVTALLLGMLVSIKWTGLAIAGLVAIAWLAEGIMQRIDLRRFVGEALLVLVIVGSVYAACFGVHFALLTKSGEGDAFMSERFQSTLQGNPHYAPSANVPFWDKFIELNKEMYTAQSSLNDVTHPYASRWYTWPLEQRTVYYWQGETLLDGRQGNIYLLGNPAVWWTSAIGAVTTFIIWLARPRWLGRQRKLVAFLLLGYALNFLPFVFIERPMFLYHYLFALLFSIIMTCVFFARALEWVRMKYGVKEARQVYWIIIGIVIGCFLYFLPLSYGWPLTPVELQQHMWLPSWR